MVHVLLAFVVFAAAGLGLALGVLCGRRPLPRGCAGFRDDACPRRSGDADPGGCGGWGACGREEAS
jgi:hypothetical protein